MPEQFNSVSIGPRTVLVDFEAMVQDYYSGMQQVDEDVTSAGIQSRSPRKPEENICGLIRNLYSEYVIVISDRDERYRKECETWLQLNDIHSDGLLMRPRGDCSGNANVKMRLYDEQLKGKQPLVWLVIESDFRCMSMWQSEGLTCLYAGRSSNA
tara:strand:- start:2707 stop:3171 length:465 start_codon:yes stop_codon:yes gene_type:complete